MDEHEVNKNGSKLVMLKDDLHFCIEYFDLQDALDFCTGDFVS